jgi:hypothetical protein
MTISMVKLRRYTMHKVVQEQAAISKKKVCPLGIFSPVRIRRKCTQRMESIRRIQWGITVNTQIGKNQSSLERRLDSMHVANQPRP